MPLFFLVGGYANSSSWSSHRAQGGNWAGWLYRRMERLLRPATLYLAVGVIGTVVARLARVDLGVLESASWLVAIHLWFLAVYLAVVAATPSMFAAHRRWRGTVPAILAAALGAIDIARVGFDVTSLGYLNLRLDGSRYTNLDSCREMGT
jgi:fucose 4-O-acetylase-like acetyltransferase